MPISEARFIRAETAPPLPGEPCPYCFHDPLERSEVSGHTECNGCFEHWEAPEGLDGDTCEEEYSDFDRLDADRDCRGLQAIGIDWPG